MKRLQKIVLGRAYKIMCFVSSAVFGLLSEVNICFANGSTESGSVDEVTKSVTGPMNSVISVVLAILACVGVFMLVKSISELVNSIQQQDNSGIFHAARGMAAAVLMISIKLIIKLFGYDF